MYVDVDGEKLFYRTFGSGEKVFLLVHNAVGSHRFFDPQIPVLEKLGKVFVLDLPGHGESISRNSPKVESFAQTVTSFCKKLKIRKMHAIGLNYGANVLLEVAIRSELISSLMMIDPPIFFTSKVKGLIEANISSLETQGAAAHAKSIVSVSFKNPKVEYTTLALEVFTNMDMQILADLYRDLLRWDSASQEILEKVSIPMLCVLTEGALCGKEALQECNPSIKVTMLQNSLYWAKLDAPKSLNRLIAEFF
jgi:pimeloyl-ACP methyl ester carboxylesterase